MERQEPLESTGSLFYSLMLGLNFWPRLGDLFVSQNRREFYADSDLCIDHFLYGYNSTICTVPCG